MSDFFSQVQTKTEATHKNATFELPILYFRDDLFVLFFTGSFDKIKSLMPSKNLHPVRMFGNKALVGFAVFNYIDTTIGPYGEVGVVLPAVYGPKPPIALIPGLMEAKFPGFGSLVMHLPVTKSVARDAGRGQWGYTKFVADMAFTNTPEFHQCALSEKGESILTLRVAKKGFSKKDNKPVITYSVKDGNLIKTVIPQKGRMRMCFNMKGSFLKLGEHPVAQTIRDLEISEKPFLSRYYIERSAILPAGEIIEKDVAPFEGYAGEDREGIHDTVYLSDE